MINRERVIYSMINRERERVIDSMINRERDRLTLICFLVFLYFFVYHHRAMRRYHEDRYPASPSIMCHGNHISWPLMSSHLPPYTFNSHSSSSSAINAGSTGFASSPQSNSSSSHWSCKQCSSKEVQFYEEFGIIHIVLGKDIRFLLPQKQWSWYTSIYQGQQFNRSTKFEKFYAIYSISTEFLVDLIKFEIWILSSINSSINENTH